MNKEEILDLTKKISKLSSDEQKRVSEFVESILSQTSSSGFIMNVLPRKERLRHNRSSVKKNRQRHKRRSKKILDNNSSLLNLVGKWQGDDFEACLQDVYDSRTGIEA